MEPGGISYGSVFRYACIRIDVCGQRTIPIVMACHCSCGSWPNEEKTRKSTTTFIIGFERAFNAQGRPVEEDAASNVTVMIISCGFHACEVRA